jgi:hypothetical protein
MFSRLELQAAARISRAVTVRLRFIFEPSLTAVPFEKVQMVLESLQGMT